MPDRFEDTFMGRPNTIRAYRSLYLNHILSLGSDDIPNALNKWKEKGLSVRTRQVLLRLLRDYRKFYNLPPVDIKQYHKMLTREEQQPELVVLTDAQGLALTHICRRVEPKFLPVLLLGLHAGLRRGEVFGLRCGDVDMIKGRIKVSRSYDGPTKNGRTRFVPMSKELVDAMTMGRNVAFRAPEERIFEIHDPNPILRRLCRFIEAPEIRFHDLRHTFATTALERGISPKQVQLWLGHSNVTTTLGIYWNVTQDEVDINKAVGG